MISERENFLRTLEFRYLLKGKNYRRENVDFDHFFSVYR
jgi:hypothetical protein